MAPIKTEFIKFPKCDLIRNRLLIAIDSGNSLTKILFLNKNNNEQFLNEEEKLFTLDFCLFPNAEFENAIKWIKTNAFGLDDNCYSFHVTGVLASSNRSKIESILNKEVVFIDEFLTIAAGHKFALEHIGIENMLAKTVNVESFGLIENKVFDKFTEAMKTLFNTEENLLKKLYPCLFHVHGSCSGCFYFDENGMAEYFGILNHGGKNFLGLAKCLLDTNDYNEIVDLASRGNRANVDTLVKDVLSENVDSPYGKIPPELPILGFGKCTDDDKDVEHFRKEDLALSLVALHAQTFVTFCFSICVTKRISKIFLTGNLFNSDVFQREIQNYLNFFPLMIDFIVLNCGYFGALGAMFCNNEEIAKYIKLKP